MYAFHYYSSYAALLGDNPDKRRQFENLEERLESFLSDSDWNMAGMDYIPSSISDSYIDISSSDFSSPIGNSVSDTSLRQTVFTSSASSLYSTHGEMERNERESRFSEQRYKVYTDITIIKCLGGSTALECTLSLIIVFIHNILP